MKLNPVHQYNAPNLPTSAQAKTQTGLLKKMPARWQTKAAVISCMAVMGMVALAGCDLDDFANNGGATPPYYTTNGGTQYTALERAIYNAELELRTHTGGSGWGPFYVVHLTEADAQRIVRHLLEEAGLQFGARPPRYSVNLNDIGAWNDDVVEILGYDSRRNVGVAHVTWAMNNQPFFSHGGPWLAEQIAGNLNAQARRSHIGVFFNPSENLGMAYDFPGWHSEYWNVDGEYEPPTDARKAEAKEAIIANLTAQVDAFIAQLQALGVL